MRIEIDLPSDIKLYFNCLDQYSPGDLSVIKEPQGFAKAEEMVLVLRIKLTFSSSQSFVSSRPLCYLQILIKL